jgi:hypothetical protein
MFKMLALLLALYVARCLVVGNVYGRSGPWGRSWSRATEPLGYWGALGSYSVLALAMFFVF